MYLRLDKHRDVVYDASDGIYHHVDAEHDFYVPLWELYARRYVACLFHLRVYFFGQSHSHDLCADFQVLVPQGAFGTVGEVKIGGSVGGQHPSVELDKNAPHQQRVESTVFISVGEFPQSSEGKVRGIGSIVGLRAVDDCPLHGRDAAKVFPLVREPLASVLNWELNRFVHPLGLGNAEVTARQRPKEMIEGAPKVVDDVSQKDAYAKPPFVVDCCDTKDMLTRLRVQLGAELDKIGFVVQGTRDYGLQAIAMFVRPLDLSSTRTQIDAGGFHGDFFGALDKAAKKPTREKPSRPGQERP